MENKTAKRWLVYVLLLIVLLPLAEQQFGFIKSGPLLCGSKQNPNTKLTLRAWWDGTYQNAKSLYLNDSVGFRPDLVRLSNQLDFSLFRKLSAGDIIGYDGYVFGREDVTEYCGSPYMGEEVIRAELIKVKRLQDTLQRLGKTFIFAYAPSKAHCMPAQIPGLLTKIKVAGVSNYSTFRTIGDSLHLNQLDYVALFRSMNDTTQNQLMTRQGFHWSVYGSLVAADTMIKFIERERNIKMPGLVLTKMHYSDTARDSDNDLVKCTNLIFPLSGERYSYPEYYYHADTNATRPKAIFIGDSFIWGLVGNGFLQNSVADWKYWTYFNDVYSEHGAADIRAYDWKKALSESDCVVILMTPMNFHILTWKRRFLQMMYDYYYPVAGSPVKTFS